MARSGSSALSVRDLSVSYAGGRIVLRGVGFDVRHGGALAVLGNNGAGKTTLLRAVSACLGLHGGSVSAGMILVHGSPLSARSPAQAVRQGIALVPEGRRVFSSMTVADNLAVGGLVATPAQRRATLDVVHSLFPVLADRSRQRAGALSGGEQQQLAIGRALMSQPSVLLLDEPSLGLAPLMVETVMKSLAEIRRAGVALVLVEQNAAAALAVADSAVVLDVGSVALEGSSDELRDSAELRDLVIGRRPRLGGKSAA